jgi:hypothetical protein
VWERASKIASFQDDCTNCGRLGKAKYKTDKPVCFITGADCARVRDLPPLDADSLSSRATAAFQLFNACYTQWRVGFGGQTGLDYPACRLVAESDGYDWDDLFPLLRALEGERLTVLNEERKRNEEDEKRKAKK